MHHATESKIATRHWAAWLCLVWFCGAPSAHADSTFVYAVQVSAAVQASPPQIALSWEPDPYGANSYTVYRKAKEATSWGPPLASLPGWATGYTDTAVTVATPYEYQIVKAASLGYIGYGYIFSGIQAPPIEHRGTLILLVGSESVIGLDNELARLVSDLIGDGWQVIRHDVSTNDLPQNVRQLILGDYWADPADVNAVFLLGHVPILQSGYMDYDGHGARPMPADAYYGDMNNDWPTDPTNSPNYLPSDVPLMIGRVDLANMPGASAPVPWPSEGELLRNYLNKDHAWRTHQLQVQRLALMGNRRGDESGLAVAASGYRAFEPLVGPGTTIEANIQDTAPNAQRWSSMLATGNYLWAYGCGAGQDTAISFLGTNGIYYDVWSTDIVGQDAHAVFVMVFGSHLGNWDHTDNIMRSVLATPSVGLACCMSGEPHWFFHHMGLGETIGYSTRLSLNNSTLYQNYVNPFTRAVYIALMGDPTLRLDPVSPVPFVKAQATSSGVTVSWGAPSDAVAGFLVYRSTSTGGPFARLTSALQTGFSFNDNTVASGTYTYMVRTVALTTNPSGSYFNPSQGAFATVSVTNGLGLEVAFVSGPEGLMLNWNSQPGALYHVEGTSSLSNPNWVNLSGSIQATGTTTSWTDPGGYSVSRRFYRVGNP